MPKVIPQPKKRRLKVKPPKNQKADRGKGPLEDSMLRARAVRAKQKGLRVPIGYEDVKISKIEELKCYPEVLNMIKAGYAATVIADFIQQERKEYLEVSRKGVCNTLYRYIKNMPGADIVRERLPAVYMAIVSSIKDQIDGIQAMSNLFHIQFDRLMVDYATEKAVGKLFDSNSRNVQICSDIAFKMEEMKLKVAGSYARTNPTISSSTKTIEEQNDETKRKIAEKYGSRMAAIGSDPARRRKLLDLYERISKAGEEGFVKILKKYENKLEGERKQDMKKFRKDIIDNGFGDMSGITHEKNVTEQDIEEAIDVEGEDRGSGIIPLPTVY